MRIGLVGTGRIGAFHAKTLTELSDVDEVVITDLDAARASEVAHALGASTAPDVSAMLDQGVDGFVITTATSTHAHYVRAGIEAGVPTFCEKPVAVDLAGSIDLAELAATATTPVQIGFQRRFDDGYRAVRAAVESGELGFIHSIRCATHDQSPPPAAYIPTSGGLFRDCNVHDFDIIRFVTGLEVRSVYAVGANKGDPFFTAGGDVDSSAAVLTLEDDTLVVVTATRYNGGGHDVRMEVHGSAGAMAVGLDDSFAFRSAQPGVDFPRGPQYWSYMERFLPAYQAELEMFVQVAMGSIPSPCTVRDGLEAFRIAEACQISKDEGRPVGLAEIPSVAN